MLLGRGLGPLGFDVLVALLQTTQLREGGREMTAARGHTPQC